MQVLNRVLIAVPIILFWAVYWITNEINLAILLGIFGGLVIIILRIVYLKRGKK